MCCRVRTLPSAPAPSPVDSQVVILELLKIRFGESALQPCEAMIKDITETKRITSNIQQMVAKDGFAVGPKVDTLILSKLFWPDMPEDDFRLHPSLDHLQVTGQHMC